MKDKTKTNQSIARVGQGLDDKSCEIKSKLILCADGWEGSIEQIIVNNQRGREYRQNTRKTRKKIMNSLISVSTLGVKPPGGVVGHGRLRSALLRAR